MQANMQCQVIAILLRRGRAIDNAASVVTIIGLLAALAPWWGVDLNVWFSLAALLTVLLGLVQKYWAARVAIDAELFSLLATKNHHTEEALAELDYALQQLSLAPITEHTRSLEERGRGALRLLRWQLIFFSTQVIFIVAACGAALFI